MRRTWVLAFICLFLMSFAACHKANDAAKDVDKSVQADNNTKDAENKAAMETSKQEKAKEDAANTDGAKPEADDAKPEADGAKPEADGAKPEADAIKPNDKFNLKTPIAGLNPGEKCEVQDGFCEEFMEEGATLIAWRKAFKRSATGEVTDDEIEKAIPDFIPNKAPKNVRLTLSDDISEALGRPVWSVAYETGGNEDTRFVKASVTADAHYLYAYIVSRSEFSNIEELVVTRALLELVF